MAAPKKNRGLGKGLDALFGDAEVTLERKPAAVNESHAAVPAKTEEKKEEPAAGGITYIDINDIKPNENQPR